MASAMRSADAGASRLTARKASKARCLGAVTELPPPRISNGPSTNTRMVRSPGGEHFDRIETWAEVSGPQVGSPDGEPAGKAAMPSRPAVCGWSIGLRGPHVDGEAHDDG